jgi:essential nuclear protein 1
VDMRGDLAMEASAEEQAMLRRFMPDSATERRTLADVIMEKLKEVSDRNAGAADAASGDGMSDGGPADAAGRPSAGLSLDPKVVEVYTEVGRFLSHYKSGSLPKVFKVIPALSEWENVLFLTSPETWTPHATYAATRIFSSNLNPAKAQRFYNLVLLPKCRDDVHAHGRMNFHLYLALKKATYKSAAFYKGVLLPLAASGDCTLREAVIFGSVVAKTAIPQLHSAAALIKLATMPYSGAVSIFLRVRVFLWNSVECFPSCSSLPQSFAFLCPGPREQKIYAPLPCCRRACGPLYSLCHC